jgi:hypothetical protein
VDRDLSFGLIAAAAILAPGDASDRKWRCRTLCTHRPHARGEILSARWAKDDPDQASDLHNASTEPACISEWRSLGQCWLTAPNWTGRDDARPSAEWPMPRYRQQQVNVLALCSESQSRSRRPYLRARRCLPSRRSRGIEKCYPTSLSFMSCADQHKPSADRSCTRLQKTFAGRSCLMTLRPVV